MSFEQASRTVWQQMRMGTGQDHPIDTGPYEASFYGGGEQGIDFDKLVKFLKAQQSDSCMIYYRPDYEKGFTPGTMPWREDGRDYIIDTKVPNTVDFKFTNEFGEAVTINISGKLNKRTDYLDKETGFILEIDPAKKRARATLEIFYADTHKYREDIAQTSQTDDFRIARKYVAISLTVENLTHFSYLMRSIFGDDIADNTERYIAKKFADLINHTFEGAYVNFLFSSIPEFAFPLLKKMVSFNMLKLHLDLLQDYDDSGVFSWFKDSSGSLINLFSLMCDGYPTNLFELMRTDPAFLKRIYTNLNDTSQLFGQRMENYLVFANLLNALCSVNDFKNLTPPGKTFYIGGSYGLDSNLFPSFDKDQNKIFLKQTITTTRHYNTTHHDEFGVYLGTTENTSTSTDDVDEGADYYPLDLVLLIDMSTTTREPVMVPAILVKAISDQKEWRNFQQNVRIGLDVLALIIGIASLGTGSPLALALAVADIGLTAADIVVAVNQDELMKTEDGRKFLEIWDKIMIVGGIITAGPLLLRSAFKIGAKLLSQATLAATRNFLRSSLLKIMLEINMANFVRGTEKILDTAREIVLESKNIFKEMDITTLQNAGVVFVKGEVKAGGNKNILAIIYNGEVIAHGEANIVKLKLKKIWSYGGPRLVQELELLAQKAERIRFMRNDPSFLQSLKQKPYQIHECESFVDLEREYGMTARVSGKTEAGDIIANGGKLNGQSLDPLGVYYDAATIERWRLQPDKMLHLFKESLDRHFAKIANPKIGLPPLDKVVIDFRYMDFVHPQLRKQVLRHINSNSYKYKQYVKDEYLIKLNY